MTLEEWKAQSVGGDHYRRASNGGAQPIDLILSHNLSWLEGEAIAAICRWREKNGLADVRKAIGLLELLVSLEEERLFDGPQQQGLAAATPTPAPSAPSVKHDSMLFKSLDEIRYGGQWLGDL